jgi:hypothetical protein
VTSFSLFQTDLWPDSWKAAIGRGAEDYRVVGANARTVDPARTGDVRILHARITWLAFTAGEFVLEVLDSGGILVVQVPSQAIGARELQIDNEYEFQVRYEHAIDSPLADSWDKRCAAVVERMTRLK